MTEAARAKSIGRTALMLLPFQALFRGGEAALPLLLAAWFGRGSETDLYYLLAAYFVFAVSILTGAFQDSAVVPVLIEVRAKDPDAMPTVAGALLGHTLGVGALVAIAMGGVAAIVAWLGSPLRVLAVELIALMGVALLATAVRAFYVGFLNARGRFRAHPIASGLGVGVMLALIWSGRHAMGVLVIPAATAAGEIVAIVILAAIASRDLGRWIVPSLARPEPVRRMISLVRFEVLGQLVTRINPVIDQLMSGLAAVVGGGTLLRYSTDVASLPTSIIQATLLPVFLTRISEEAATPARFSGTLKKTLFAVVALLVALSAVFALVRTPLCRLLFLHGEMDESGVTRIAEILPWALAGVAPFGALLILARAHVALQNSRIMPSMGILNAACNLAFNALLVGPLGLSGIALSTSITYAIVALVFWLRLPRDARRG